MRKALFLGNSHVSAYKLAYDRLAEASPFECVFYCAWCADLAFTEVRDLALVPVVRNAISSEALKFFFSDEGPSIDARYLTAQQPLKDVGQQFLTTGGSSAIDLTDITDVFYAAGTSPYDFRRLGEYIFPFTDALRRELLQRMLDRSFLLRDQIVALKATAPHVRHHFIGVPLRKWPPAPLNEALHRILDYNRASIARLSGDYLFDSVFMPGPSVLGDDLVSTRPELFRTGRQQSEAYQAIEPTDEDDLHANADYGAIVFEEFIAPLLREPPIPALAPAK